jgi:hypothetical protein
VRKLERTAIGPLTLLKQATLPPMAESDVVKASTTAVPSDKAAGGAAGSRAEGIVSVHVAESCHQRLEAQQMEALWRAAGGQVTLPCIPWWEISLAFLSFTGSCAALQA